MKNCIKGEKYDVPIFCINDPASYDVPKETKIDKKDIRKTTINVNFSGYTRTNLARALFLDQVTLRRSSIRY